MEKQFSRVLVRSISFVLMLALFVSSFAGCKSTTDDGSEYSIYTSVVYEDDYTEDEGDSAANNSSDSSTAKDSGSSSKGGSGSNTAGGNNSSSKGSSGSSSSSSKNNSSSNGANDSVKTEGKTFTIMSSYLPQSKSKAQYTFEKLFWERAEEVEEEYGVKIKVIDGYPNTNNLAALIMAGKKVANILETNVEDLTGLASAGYIIPWDNVNGVDVKNSNFWSGYTNAATLGTKHYGVQFEKPPELRYCVVVNKTMLAGKGINADEIYNLVEKNQWTFAKFLEYAKATTDTSKGTYGLGGTPSKVAQMLMAANGGKVVTINSKGKASATYTSKNIKNALDWMYDLVNTNKVYYTVAAQFEDGQADSSAPDYIQAFVDGKIAFLMDDSWVLNQQIRPKVAKKGNNISYGLLPVPLGPDAGNKGYTSLSSYARVFTITKTNNEQDFTAKILNALAEYPEGYDKNSWQDEIAADYFQDGDTKSLNMYVKLLENMESDPGVGLPRVYSAFIESAMETPIFYDKNTPSAAIDAIGTTYNKTIEGLF